MSERNTEFSGAWNDAASDAASCGRDRSSRRLLPVMLAFAGLSAMLTSAGPAQAQSRTVFATAYAGAPGNAFTFNLGGVGGNTATASNLACQVGNMFLAGFAPAGTNYPGGFFTPAPTPGATPAQRVLLERSALVTGCAAATTRSGLVTLNFAQAFESTAVRMHFRNIDAGRYDFAPTAGLTIVRLSGNNEFEVGGTVVNTTQRIAAADGCEANNGTNGEGGCGTIRFDAAAGSLNQIIWDAFDLDPLNPGGDGHNIFFSLTQPSLLIRKRTVGGTGSTSFTFSYPTNVQSDAATPTAATGEAIAVGSNNTFVNGQPRFIANSLLNTGIAETVPAGWVVSGTCYDVSTPAAPIATIDASGLVVLPAAAVTPAMQIQCDFTNTRVRTVTVVKALSPAADAGRFDLQINGATVATNAGNGGNGATAGLVVGTTVTVAELAGTPNPGLANYTTTLTCTGGAIVTPGANNRSGTFTLPDADVTCTFTNTRVPRTVTLRKALSPAADTSRFNLQVNGANVATNVGNDGSGSNTAVTPGTTVTIAELAGTPNVGLNGYTTTLLCTGATVTPGANNRSGTFTMPDANVDCTFTNTAIVNLAITKTATPAGTYLPGQALNYTIAVTNNGPAAASGIAVSDTVPASVTVSGWTCTATGAGADCDTTAAGTGATGTTNAIALSSVALGPGQSLSIAVTGAAALSATGAIVNNATATPPTGVTCTTAPCNVSSTTTNTNGGTPQLTIVKTATPGSFAVGQPATYSLQASNTGTSSTAGTISVSDPLPAGITATLPITAAGWDCTASTTTQVNCSTNAVLLPGSNAPIINVTIAVAPATANPAVNTATVQGGGDPRCPLPMPQNERGGGDPDCRSSVDVPVDAPLLTIVKTANPASFMVDEAASYILTVTNSGTAATTEPATIEDPVPVSLTLGAMPADCTNSGQVVTCTIAAGLAPNAQAQFVIPVTPTAAATGIIGNTATITRGDPACPQAERCSGTVDVPVGELLADLRLTKDDGGGLGIAGRSITWTLTASNHGPNDAVDVTVRDPIPPGLTFVSAGGNGWTCGQGGGVVTCARPALANGARAAIALTLAVPAGYAGPSPIVNTANVTSTTPDPDPDNNSGTDETPTNPREVMPVPALSWPALLGMILMLGGFALITRARRRV